ncbi:YMGG-like glycine zipper-containing protein [Pseudomonas sp. GW456-12-1-14-TSB6]|uniref:YMGG-like glycine zipper-containing protein n=1 Tax=Pseudomonas sp. GW456-12-1-14-TSB6 TaxID=2751350 RepID=UPI0015A9951B|nr:YMGG-like glycine zipper-containing protein [Pseudomonas sp. GW456-12-1-14-TSB6]
MNRLPIFSLFIFATLATTQASAESVVPLKGQTSQQTQIDINDCHSIASTSTTSTPQAGGRLKGAAAGAAAGATAAEVRGRQHDEFYEAVDDDRKQDYRQNRAKETAAAGAVVGGARQRQDRREQRRTDASASSSAYTGCLQGRGYQVTP